MLRIVRQWRITYARFIASIHVGSSSKKKCGRLKLLPGDSTMQRRIADVVECVYVAALLYHLLHKSKIASPCRVVEPIIHGLAIIHQFVPDPTHD